MTLDTVHLGLISVDESSTVEFPEGLPGFEDCRRFVPLEHPAEPSLIFLQSLERPGLCFLALPVRSVRNDYELELSAEDLDVLDWPEGAQPDLGRDVAALAIVSLAENQEPTANLLSPLVIRVDNRRAVQATRADQRYGCREPLLLAEPVCS
jgi:flagellar assembly factor FliW